MAHQAAVRKVQGVAELSDEVLMAYADGALSPADQQRVAAILEDRPDYAEKVKRFRESQALLRDSLGALDQSIPAEWVEQIRRAPIAATATVTDLAGARAIRTGAKPSAARSSWLPVAMAAAISLMIGAIGGWVIKPRAMSATDGAEVVAQGTVRSVLEGGVSGAVAEIAGGGGATVKPIATFKAKDGRYCRQYEIDRAGSDTIEGIACRTGSGGNWQVRYHADKTATAAGRRMAPAEGRPQKPIDAAVASLAAGGNLDAAEEARIMRDGWKP